MRVNYVIKSCCYSFVSLLVAFVDQLLHLNSFSFRQKQLLLYATPLPVYRKKVLICTQIADTREAKLTTEGGV